jgi:hypothetical protein
VRNAVVLVSETVAEAFRDAKQGGGLKSAFAGLPAGPEGITFVLSPNAHILILSFKNNFKYGNYIPIHGNTTV